MIKKFFGKILRNIIEDTKDEQKELSHDEVVNILSKHPIFEELREWSTYRSKVLNISDDKKRNMAEYYLSLLFKELRVSIYTLVLEYDECINGNITVNDTLIDSINNIKRTALVNGVPPIFLDKFTHYLYCQAKILASTYKDLDDRKYMNKNLIERATFRLDLGFMLIRCITSEVELVISNMNGELASALEGSIFDK